MKKYGNQIRRVPMELGVRVRIRWFPAAVFTTVAAWDRLVQPDHKRLPEQQCL
jgi:hypothetical protein